MRKNGTLHNMVHHLGSSVSLKPNSKIMLSAISWQANADGHLRDKYGRKISFTSCGKEWGITGPMLTNALKELEQKGLIYRIKGGGGGLVAEKIERLYNARMAKIFGSQDEDTPKKLGTPPQKNWGESPNKIGDINLTEGTNTQRAEHASSSVSQISLSECQKFVARYPKRTYLDEVKVRQAWAAALARGWSEAGLMDALARAIGRWRSQPNPRMPNADEFLQEIYLQKFAPDLAPAHGDEDAEFYQKVEAYAAEAQPKRKASRKASEPREEVPAIYHEVPNTPVGFV